MGARIFLDTAWLDGFGLLRRCAFWGREPIPEKVGFKCIGGVEGIPYFGLVVYRNDYMSKVAILNALLFPPSSISFICNVMLVAEDLESILGVDDVCASLRWTIRNLEAGSWRIGEAHVSAYRLCTYRGPAPKSLSIDTTTTTATSCPTPSSKLQAPTLPNKQPPKTHHSHGEPNRPLPPPLSLPR